MNSKAAIGILAILVLGLGGYLAYENMNKNETQNETNQTDTNQNSNQDTTVNQEEPTVTQDNTPAPSQAVIKFETTEGNFEVTLDGKAAPLTTKNFIKLTNEGFYNGLTFHRIEQIPGFRLIQGGDPSGDGTGGPGYTIPAEIGLKHTKGAIAMARTGGTGPDGQEINPTKASSGSQFYIVLEDIAQLDGGYTVFGYVTSGLNTVEKIDNIPTEPNPMTGTSVPLKEIKMTKVSVVSTKQ